MNPLGLAQHYLDIGQADKALEALKQADSETLDGADYWHLRARAFYESERYKEALEAAQKGLSINPEYTLLYYRLCRIQTRLSQLAAAERAILKALELSSEDPLFLARYGIVLAEGRQFKKADAVIAEAERVSAEDPYIGHARGMLEFYRGRHKNVIERSKARLAEDPEDLSARMLLSAGLGEARRYGEAGKHARAVLSDMPQNEAVAQYARDLRFNNHLLLKPLWLFQRFGALQVWLGAIALMIGIGMLGFEAAAGTLALVYGFLVIYSWVVPPLLRLYLKRRYG